MELNGQGIEMLIPNPRAIIFDWDNTLVDTFPIIRDALNTTLEAFGHSPWTMDETRRQVRRSARDSFPELFGNDWERAMELFYYRYYEVHTDKLKIIPGATELIERLASKSMILSVVSNKRGDVLRAEAAHLGWTDYFNALVGASDAARDKPARDPVDLALSGTNIETGPDVWFIGDADIDLECAKNADCTAILIGAQIRAADSPYAARADMEFPHCMALSNFVDKL